MALDAGFKTPSIMRKIFMSGKLPAVPYTCPKSKDGFFRKSNYDYDEYFDCFACMNLKKLALKMEKSTLFFTKLLFTINLKSFSIIIEKDFVYSLKQPVRQFSQLLTKLPHGLFQKNF